MQTPSSLGREPYMPDSARAALPNSAMQPLPAYLREDFSQSLQRERPHELVVRFVNGRPVHPFRQGVLTYRYLDTGDTVTVPNVWYNQTVQARLGWWKFQVEYSTERLRQAQQELDKALACSSPLHEGVPLERAIQEKRWRVEDIERVLHSCQQALEDVFFGRRFV